MFPTSPFPTACYALSCIIYDDLPRSTVDLDVLAATLDRTFDPFEPCFGLAVLCSCLCNAIAALKNGKATYVKAGDRPLVPTSSTLRLSVSISTIIAPMTRHDPSVH